VCPAGAGCRVRAARGYRIARAATINRRDSAIRSRPSVAVTGGLVRYCVMMPRSRRTGEHFAGLILWRGCVLHNDDLQAGRLLGAGMGAVLVGLVGDLLHGLHRGDAGRVVFAIVGDACEGVDVPGAFAGAERGQFGGVEADDVGLVQGVAHRSILEACLLGGRLALQAFPNHSLERGLQFAGDGVAARSAGDGQLLARGELVVTHGRLPSARAVGRPGDPKRNLPSFRY
jgi:hypothetical protein